MVSTNSARLSANLAVSESGFVFMPTTGETFAVNPVGQIILRALQAGKSTEQIVEEVCREFEVEKKSVERDLTDFLAQLRLHNLLT